MNAKEYLSQYQTLRYQEENLQANIQSLRDEAGAVSLTLDGLPRGTDIADKTGKLATTIADLTLKSISKRDEILSTRHEIENTLRQLHDNRIYRVLYARYIQGERWEKIAVNMGYTYRNVVRLHGQGVCAIQKILDEK